MCTHAHTQQHTAQHTHSTQHSTHTAHSTHHAHTQHTAQHTHIYSHAQCSSTHSPPQQPALRHSTARLPPSSLLAPRARQHESSARCTAPRCLHRVEAVGMTGSCSAAAALPLAVPRPPSLLPPPAPSCVLRGHSSRVTCLLLHRPSPSAPLQLISGDGSGVLRWWDLHTRRAVAALPAHGEGEQQAEQSHNSAAAILQTHVEEDEQEEGGEEEETAEEEKGGGTSEEQRFGPSSPSIRYRLMRSVQALTSATPPSFRCLPG